MNYISQVKQVCKLLDNVAKRGFLSPLVYYKYGTQSGKPNWQYAEFTELEDSLVREFISEYFSVLRCIDYPSESIYGKSCRTASLLQMLLSMLDDSSPTYVADNSIRLLNSLETHKEEYDNLEFNKTLEL